MSSSSVTSDLERNQILREILGRLRQTDSKSNADDLETAERILGIENLILRWMGVAALFIASAFVIIGLVKTERKYYGKIFFAISAFILFILLAEYFMAREELQKEGIKIPDRVNWLAVIMATTLIVLLILIYDYSQAGNN